MTPDRHRASRTAAQACAVAAAAVLTAAFAHAAPATSSDPPAPATPAPPPTGTATPQSPAQAAHAQRNYTQFCSGCHLADGSGSPTKGIPSFHDTLAPMLALPQGRAYVIQVPGIMNSGLRDADVAELVNWLVPRMSLHGPRPASPNYSAAEIARLRGTRPTDVPAARRHVLEQLARRPIPAPDLYTATGDKP